MKPSQLFEALDVCRKAGRAPNIQGPPGGGKTTIVRSYTESIDYAWLLLDLPMIYDPVDTRGIPANVNGKTTWLPPDYLHFNGKPTVVGLRGLRAAMGEYGVSPSDLAYIFGIFGYVKLLDDTNVLTIDKIGPNATIRSDERVNWDQHSGRGTNVEP